MSHRRSSNPDGPARFHRRSIRLRGYDYAQAGAYFLTICTHRRAWLFGEVRDGRMCPNELGRLVEEEWRRSGAIRHEVAMDEFVVMPDHIHGIVWIDLAGAVGGGADADGGAGMDAGGTAGRAGDGGATVGAHGRAPLRSTSHTIAPEPGIRVPSPAGAPRPSFDPPLHRAPRSLGSFVAGFKASVTVKVNAIRDTPGLPLWQRNYYERIIRDETALNRMRVYIRDNPQRWSGR